MAGSRKTFYTVLAAGIAFIVIGIAASIYSNVAVDVPLDGTVRPGLTDDLTPDMNVGNTATIIVNGSVFDIDVKEPDDTIIISGVRQSNFAHQFTAQKAGEHTILITNIGDTELTVTGHAQTKASPLAFSAPLMLAVTGIIVIGLSLRFRRR